MSNEIKQYAKESYDGMMDLLKELCHIPAPSHYEHKRAEYCKKWFERIGGNNAYIDDALNTVFPINCENSDEITVFVAHNDTVFPDMEPMPYLDDGEKIHCPGAGDDTASVVVLMYMAKYFVENGITPEKGVMFVCNSCEEGLGNLKGTRQLFKDFEGRIKTFVSFDSTLNRITDACVGSHRYEVEVLTEGGHSYSKFGNDNAIDKLSQIISEIYKIKVPEKEGTKTTYNVGTISGGTSVNTIAQNAKMLCEYRSTDVECLEIMREKFEDIFENANTDKIKVNVTRVGDRPCSNIEPEKIDVLRNIAAPIVESVTGKKATYGSSSTDCNIPLSLGVPAICIGTNIHQGAHTRSEWVDKASLVPGLEVAIKLGIAYTEENL